VKDTSSTAEWLKMGPKFYNVLFEEFILVLGLMHNFCHNVNVWICVTQLLSSHFKVIFHSTHYTLKTKFVQFQ